MSEPTTTQQPPQSNPFSEFGGSATSATPATPGTPTPTSAQPTVQSAAQADPFAEFGGVKVAAQKASTDPRKTGEIVNDVGNKVIVPKDGESFADTMKRAVQYHKSLTPEQQQAAIDKETATMPKKAAQTLGAAATIGVVGPAVLATTGEIGEALPSVIPHTIEGVKTLTAWAAKNPVQAYLLYQVVKELVPGAKKAMGVLKNIPDAE
jgi:hypothetical protein